LAARARPRRARTRTRAEPAEPSERPWGKILALTATAVGVVSSVVALVFTFAPDLAPERESSEQSGTLSELTLDPSAPFGQYLARVDQEPSSYTDRQLARRGALLEFSVAIVGFKGKQLRLKWELYDDASGRQVNESKAVSITPNREKNTARWPFWIPLPQRDGEFFAIVELLERKEHHWLRLDTLETERFPGRG
jgi:hypothetical protein